MQRGRTRKADGHDGWQVKKVELPGQRSPNVATSVHPAMGAHGQAGWPHVKPRFASPDLESMTWSAALDGKRHRCNQQPWHYTHYLLHYAPILRLGLWWHTTCGFAPCNRLLAFLKIIITIIIIMPLMVITAKLGCLPTSTELPHRAPLHGWGHPHFAFSEVQCSAEEQDLQIRLELARPSQIKSL